MFAEKTIVPYRNLTGGPEAGGGLKMGLGIAQSDESPSGEFFTKGLLSAIAENHPRQ
jgi:hypothetical protein